MTKLVDLNDFDLAQTALNLLGLLHEALEETHRRGLEIAIDADESANSDGRAAMIKKFTDWKPLLKQ